MYKFRWANLAHHDKFKHLINRDVNPRKVEELCKSVRQYGFLQPVVCTATGGIVDGQHRVEVSRILNIPAPYDIIEGMTDEQATEIVIEMNNKRHDWTVMNYIEAKAKAGLPDYQKLMSLMETSSMLHYEHNDEGFGKKLSPSALALAYWAGEGSKSPASAIKKGTYSVDEAFGDEVIDLVVDVLEVVGPKFYSMVRLIRSCREVLNHWDSSSPTGEFDTEIIKDTLNSSPYMITPGLDSYSAVVKQWKQAHILYRSQQTK